MYLVNGKFSETIAVADRGFQYGDGLFETIEISRGRSVFMNRHLNRLTQGCGRLQINCPDLAVLTDEVNQLAANAHQAVVKIIVTRGSGGRGYRQPDVVSPTRIVSLHPFPDYPEVFSRDGIRTRFCSTRLGLNPALAGIKHLNRLEQVMARAEWNDASIQEGLMLDFNNHVIEGTMTNLFYVQGQRLYTAPVLVSGIAGIMREVIIELAALNQLTIEECLFGVDALLAAEEIFVCNSVIGLWPVAQLAERTFPVGPVTRQIMQWLAGYKHEWL